ncbi:winged helix-turn-helix transcriptional regulator (plasmid) [Bacillus sp. F19]|nr:winged helix-turn-helix transcriptional regulator [Bacillus sp. F19]
MEYSLTELGKSLEPILSELYKRGGNYSKLLLVLYRNTRIEENLIAIYIHQILIKLFIIKKLKNPLNQISFLKSNLNNIKCFVCFVCFTFFKWDLHMIYISLTFPIYN